MSPERPQHDFGEKPELYSLRQEWTVKFDEMSRRQNELFDDLRSAFWETVARREPNLSEQEIGAEWFAVIRDATPLADEYDEGVGGEE